MRASPLLMERISSVIPYHVYKALIRRDVLHFFYHTISEEPLAHIRHLYACKTPAEFEADLIYLKQHYSPISYQQLATYVEAKKPLPPRAAMLSFDDSLAESYTIARPLLLKHGIPCIFFISTGVVDNREMLYRHKVSLCIEKASRADREKRQAAFAELSHHFGLAISGMEGFTMWIKGLKEADRNVLETACQVLSADIPGYLERQRPYLTSEQMRGLNSDGFTLGAHGVRHVKFNLLDEAGMQEELVHSCQAVQEFSREERIPFAFPFSASGVDRQAFQRILNRNKQVGLTFDTQGIKKDAAFVFNRIWSDSPIPNVDGSDLRIRVRKAYEDVFLAKMMRLRLYTGPQ
jgi:peptidoglycan/xylan/chitin deacetylase (PgdA/CDA1 family)